MPQSQYQSLVRMLQPRCALIQGTANCRLIAFSILSLHSRLSRTSRLSHDPLGEAVIDGNSARADATVDIRAGRFYEYHLPAGALDVRLEGERRVIGRMMIR